MSLAAERLGQDEDWEAIGRALHELGGTVPSVADRLVLFKMLLLAPWLELDDAALLAEVADRLSLRRFCGLAADAEPPSREAFVAFRRELLASPAGRELLLGVVRRGFAEIADASTPLLSIVSPVYRAEEIVAELVRRITEEVSRITPHFEIILVDDGSPDQAWRRIEEACAADSRVKGIRLSRNFGQHYAITAGLDHARGRWVVVMDCDLQDDPQYIRDLYEQALAGYDIVYTVKEKRQHGAVKNLGAHLFTLALNALSSGRAADARVGAFSLLSRRTVEAFRQVRDTHRHYLGVLRWLGFSSTEVVIEHQKRYRGRSSYTLKRLVRHAVDGFTSQSDRLLYLALGAGFLFLTASLVYAAWLIVEYFVHGFKEGWTSTVVLILLSTSMVLFSVGAAGIYIGKVFDQVKNRPLYLTRGKINL